MSETNKAMEPTQVLYAAAGAPGEHGAADFVLFADAEFTSKKGLHYTIPAVDGFVAQGGESVIYCAISDANEEFAAKIYSLPPRNGRVVDVYNKKCKILMELSRDPENHLMPLLDYGTVNVYTDPAIHQTCLVEIMPLLSAEQHTLKGQKISVTDIQQVYLPQIKSAIQALHSNNIIHRDIKPENFINLRDGDDGKPYIVLSDFGIAGVIDEGAPNNLLLTQVGFHGTAGYASPEAATGAFRTYSDMYSLGCTIAELLHGEYYYPVEQREGQIGVIYDHMQNCIANDAWPFHIDDPGILEAKLRKLFLGLVQAAGNNRFTLKDVNDFCIKGVDWQPRNVDVQVRFSVRFNRQQYTSRIDLAQAMAEERDESLRNMHSGALQQQLLQTNDVDAVNSLDEFWEHAATDEQKDVALCKFIHFLVPSHRIVVNGHSYINLQNLCDIAAVGDDIAAEQAQEDILLLMRNGVLSWKYEDLYQRSTNSSAPKKEFQKAAQCLKKCEKLQEYKATSALALPVLLFNFAGRDAKGKYYEPASRFSQPTEEQDRQRYLESYWEGYFKEQITYSSKACGNAKKLISDSKALAWLYYKGFNVQELIKHLDQDTDTDIHVFRLFEGKYPEFARWAYAHYGRFAYITWLQENINMYNFPATCEEIKNRLLQSDMTKGDKSIVEQNDVFLDLQPAYSSFVKSFDNNLLMAYMGIKSREHANKITSQYADAFFTETFFDHPVPLGFMRA